MLAREARELKSQQAQLARIRASLCEESAIDDLDAYALLVQQSILHTGPVWIPPGHPSEGLPEMLPRFAA